MNVRIDSTGKAYRAVLLDVGLVSAVTVITIFSTALQEQSAIRPLDPLGYTLLTAGGLFLAGIRRIPRLTRVGTLVSFLVYLMLGYPSEGFEWLPVSIAIAGSAAAGHRSMAVVTSIGLIVWMIGERLAIGSPEPLAADVLLASLGIAMALGSGEWLRVRRDYVASTEQRALLAELTKEEEALRRVADERLHIAREMHDVLAHALASINVQAGASLHVLHKHPQQAVEALGSIKRASAEALQELRGTLGTLRGENGSTSRLAQLDALLEPARNAGLTVDVHKRGEPYAPPPAVDLAVFRILQESLTNAIRYAAPADVEITLDYAPSQLLIRIEDNGAARSRPKGSDGTGTGIAGMRERATALGGTLDAGPRPRGGFGVTAAIPIEKEPS
ncbi:MAG: sensor histidine kinase [Actinomycetota bacterium]|nr:sensor histidine kinase [Actinomycetota bacterium]